MASKHPKVDSKRRLDSDYLTQPHLNAIIVAIMMKTAQELMVDLGQRARENRLGMNLTQAGLAKRSGESLEASR